MIIIKTKNYDELSRKAADIIGSVVVLKPDAVLGLATGSTPVGTYKELIKDYEAGKLDFSAVKSVNLDEYKGLTGDHDQSYRYFMNTNLFDHVNIDKANTNVPSGIVEDGEAECERYNELIKALGGIDRDYTDKDSFYELEKEYKSFTRVYKEQWEKTKKRIRKKHLTLENFRGQNEQDKGSD